MPCGNGFPLSLDHMENKASDEVEKVKTKFMSAWHNVKYNDEDFTTASCEAPDEDFVMGDVEAFRKDFASRLWLTYREGFPPLPGSTLTSDCGWGCMLRAGQMMLAQALIMHFQGRDWTWSQALALQPLDTETWTTSAAKRLVASLEASLQGSPQPPNRASPPSHPARALGPAEEAEAHLKELYHRTLVSWFGDSPAAQLGLHRLVQLGLTLGKQAGDWYGPAVVSHILKKAVKEAVDPGLAGVTAYISQDCTVYCADVIDCHTAPKAGQTPEQASCSLPLPESTSSSLNNRAVFILIPVRLGGEKINSKYFDFTKSILSLDYCVGIIGGKPKQACYFVGFQDESLIYMDPHYCQSSVDVSTSDFPLQSFHCPSPKKMPFSKMDPSCTIGFYSRSVEDFERIRQELSKVLQPSAKDKYPAFTLVQGHSRDYDLSAALTPEKREWPFIRDPRRTVTTSGDFVLL
ncbi:cysteine protease ATG4C isoform X2 [Gouania willdenowi]|uniref:Cysteine protease n=1 Tax=Gouania willdenowi TaxID=441366 RepID=A0A8C5N7I2_GOUWI|nr:cysteine protease ATG4C isoform X2 [Gouania willdenowi]